MHAEAALAPVVARALPEAHAEQLDEAALIW